MHPAVLARAGLAPKLRDQRAVGTFGEFVQELPLPEECRRLLRHVRPARTLTAGSTILQSVLRIDSVRFQETFVRGTFLPSLRALESPMATACLRLFTLPPLPPGPLLAVPRL